MLLDGFHGVFLALCIESSPFCIPLWQQLSLSLSEANGFLTESPQVVYLFVEVKRKQCGQDKDLPPPSSFYGKQQETVSSIYKCHPSCLSDCHPTALHPVCCSIVLFSFDLYLTPLVSSKPQNSTLHQMYAYVNTFKIYSTLSHQKVNWQYDIFFICFTGFLINWKISPCKTIPVHHHASFFSFLRTTYIFAPCILPSPYSTSIFFPISLSYGTFSIFYYHSHTGLSLFFRSTVAHLCAFFQKLFFFCLDWRTPSTSLISLAVFLKNDSYIPVPQLFASYGTNLK